MRRLFKLVYLAAVAAVYGLVFHRYVPADVTQGLWLRKEPVMMALGAIFGAMLLLRIISILGSKRRDKRGLRFFMTLLLLPFYAFVSLFVMLVINGYDAPKVQADGFQTNLVYLRDLKVACITAALSDEKIEAGGVHKPTILFVPGSLCQNIEPSVAAPGKHPYILSFSGGRLGVAYLVDIIKDSSHN